MGCWNQNILDGTRWLSENEGVAGFSEAKVGGVTKGVSGGHMWKTGSVGQRSSRCQRPRWEDHLSAESPRIKAGMVLERMTEHCLVMVLDRASESLLTVRIRQETCLS